MRCGGSAARGLGPCTDVPPMHCPGSDPEHAERRAGMWNLTSLRVARACRKLGRVAPRVCSAASQRAGRERWGRVGRGIPPSPTVTASAWMRSAAGARQLLLRRATGGAFRRGPARRRTASDHRRQRRPSDASAWGRDTAPTDCDPNPCGGYAARTFPRAVDRLAQGPQTSRSFPNLADVMSRQGPRAIRGPQDTCSQSPMLTPQRAYGQHIAPLTNLPARLARSQAEHAG